MVGVSEFPREDDVAVNDAADGIANRLVHVVTIHQNGENARDRAALSCTDAF